MKLQLDLLGSATTGDAFTMQAMFAMMHTGDFQGLEAVDRIIHFTAHFRSP